MVILLLHQNTPFFPLKVGIISSQMALLRNSELSLTEISFPTFVLFCTALLFFLHTKSGLFLQGNWSFLVCFHSTVNSCFPLTSLSLPSQYLSLQGHLTLPFSLCSAALLPCSSLLHSGLSYIMHVKQTDMSESLKCMAVPSLLLHPPWEGGHVSKAPMCSPGPAELQSAKANTNVAFYCGKINVAPIPVSIYTKSLRWNLFHRIKSY